MVEQTVELLRSAHAIEPSGHICVVCKSKADAEALYCELREWHRELQVPVRLGHNKQFEFARGISVSNARQVKGLEFDSVIVFDPSPKNYPASTDGRRALYMVITRAKERLHFVAQHKVSSLLMAAIDGGFLEVSQKPTVPPVQLTAEDEEPF
jgi:DNA helicase II / ATP-dependent DNA helicase PcrA